MFEKLFTPIKIRGMELKHRIVMPAMGTKFSGQASYVTPTHINYHVERVKGGSALNIVEVCSVHTPSAPRGFLSISEDEYIPGLKELTDAIHAEGGKAGLQLWQGSLAVGSDQTAQILMACDTPFSEEITLPGATIEEIKEVVTCFGKAAARAVEAGFDCVEFHCAHNYLPHSFLSGGINFRTDEYGGSFENRAKFPLECIRAIRENIPEDMPLFMRIDAHDDYLEGGLTIEEVIEFCKLAGEAGVDVLDVSRGNIISAATKYEVPPIDIPRGFNIDNAARIRKETGMLTIGVGRINTVGARAAEEGINKAILREAVAIQMTWPGAPTVYYGDEAGVCGFTDPDNRRTYPWGHEDQYLVQFYRDAIRMHRELPVLKYGSVKMLKEDYNLISFGRFNENEQVVVVINNNNENKKVEIPVWETGISRSVDTTMTRILDSNAIAYDMEQKEYPVVAGYLELEMSPLEAIVLCRGCELPQKKDEEAAEKEGDASTVLNN